VPIADIRFQFEFFLRESCERLARFPCRGFDCLPELLSIERWADSWSQRCSHSCSCRQCTSHGFGSCRLTNPFARPGREYSAENQPDRACRCRRNQHGRDCAHRIEEIELNNFTHGRPTKYFEPLHTGDVYGVKERLSPFERTSDKSPNRIRFRPVPEIVRIFLASSHSR
jgi:hypothetical protein